eukprot:gene42504-56495_t
MKTLRLFTGLVWLFLTTASTFAEESTPKVRFNQLPDWLRDDAKEAFPDMRMRGEIRQVLDGSIFVWSRPGYTPVLFQEKDGDAYYANSFDSKDDTKNQWEKLGFFSEKDSGMTKELRIAFYNKAFDDPNFGFKYNNPSKGETILLYSAIDCGYCVKLEKALHKAGVPFVVVPTTLQPKVTRDFREVYCAEDKSSAWKKMMTTRKISPQKNSRCEIPFLEFQLVGDIMGINATPSAMRPDGTIVEPALLWA